MPSYTTANFSGIDDFSAASPSWSTDNPGASGSFLLQGGELNFVTTGPPTSNDTVQRFWTANVGDFTADWSLRIDAAIDDFAMLEGQFASLALLVRNLSDPGDFARFSLRRDDVADRNIYADSILDNSMSVESVFRPTSSTLVTLGFSYDAAVHVITAAYDADGPVNGQQFRTILSVPITSSMSNWNMGPADSFEAWIVGQSVNLTVSAAQITFDNFAAASEQLPLVPEPCSAVLLVIGLAAACAIGRPRAIRFVLSSHCSLS